MSDQDASGADSKRLGPQWIVAIAGLITAVATALGLIVANDGGSGNNEANGGTPTTVAVTPTAAPDSDADLPLASILSTERLEDGRWIVHGSVAEDIGTALAKSAPIVRTYDVYVIAETNTGRRYVSAAASFESSESWRTQFSDPIETNAITFFPGVVKRFRQSSASSYGRPQSVPGTATSARELLESRGPGAFSRSGAAFTESE
jgi:hypothetical protein